MGKHGSSQERKHFETISAQKVLLKLTGQIFYKILNKRSYWEFIENKILSILRRHLLQEGTASGNGESRHEDGTVCNQERSPGVDYFFNSVASFKMMEDGVDSRTQPTKNSDYWNGWGNSKHSPRTCREKWKLVTEEIRNEGQILEAEIYIQAES